MTDTQPAGTAEDRAVARVMQLLDEPLRAVDAAGYPVVIPAREIVRAVAAELGDAAMRLPRYYPDDEGKAWLLGQARRVAPDSGESPGVYARWRTGLPNGRVLVTIVEADSTSGASGVSGLDLAEFTAAPDALPHVLRALLAACEHSAAGASTAGAR